MTINLNSLDSDVTVEYRKRVVTVSKTKFISVVKEFLLKDESEEKLLKLTARKMSFAKFWDQYGRKQKKDESFRLWVKLKEEDIRLIFETLPAFLRNNRDVQFRPMPPTYLRGKRWLDEQPSSTPKQLPSFAKPAFV